MLFLAMHLQGFSHSEVVLAVQMPWVPHRQLAVEPFDGPRAVSNANATLGEEVGP